jgi:hypothetical protein
MTPSSLKKIMIVGGALLLSAIASTAEAAIFTVKFAGVVDRIYLEVGTRYSPSFFGTVPERVTKNTGKLVKLADLLTGQYVFDDTTSEILEAQLRFVSPNAGTSLDPAESDPANIFFKPIVPAPQPSIGPPIFPIIGSTSQADQSSAKYELSYLGADNDAYSNFSLLENRTFSYFEGAGRRGGSYGRNYISGTINQIAVTENTPTVPTDPNPPTNPRPTDVPEPTDAFGLLLLAGLGCSLRRQPQRQA